MLVELSWLLVSFVASWLGVALLRRRPIAIDVPNARSSHSRPIARGGGLAVATVVLLLAALAAASEGTRVPISTSACLLVAGGGLAAISLADDLRNLGTLPRLLAHALAASAILIVCGPIEAIHVPGAGDISLGFLGYPFAFVWIVGLTNAYNFMDGIDGIAGAQAIVASAAWFGLGSAIGDPWIARVGLVAGGASLGFLVHNWHPARIFLGDVGSAFLGFLFAALAVLAASDALASADSSPRAAEPVDDARLFTAGIACVWPFVADASATFLRRLARGENVFAAHRSHFYQRLVIAGSSHGRVALLYASLAALSGTAGFLAALEIDGADIALGVVACGMVPALWALTRAAERSRKGHALS